MPPPPPPRASARTRRAVLALLLSPAWAVCDAEALGADRHCSACNLFIEQYLLGANGPVFHTERDRSARGVYKARLFAIYKEHAPGKERLIDGMLRYYRGREHSLYQKACHKYGVPIEPAYSKEEADAPEEEVAWRESQALGALATVVEGVEKGDTQWAVSGAEGSRRYIDFNKAASGALGPMDHLSMGGDVKEQLAECFKAFAANHSKLLALALARSARLYDSAIDKTFCYEIAGACPRDTPGGEAAEAYGGKAARGDDGGADGNGADPEVVSMDDEEVEAENGGAGERARDEL